MKLNFRKGSKGKMKKSARQKTDRSILCLVYLVVFLFLCLIGYMGYFLVIPRENVINNPYNARLDSFARTVERGRILDKSGTVLAETRTGEDGKEKRVYPYGELFSHVVGYSVRGKTGLEALGNFYLLTCHLNPVSQVTARLAGTKNPGDQIITSLDVRLQQAAGGALGGRKGVVAAMEPSTGRILAMVSNPGFDPNTVLEAWDTITADGDGQARLVNRASQGLYPPGSVFKIVMVLEYIREHPDDYEEFRFDCDGYFERGEYTIQCYHGNAHGSQNLSQAFANSCNGAFAAMGLEMDMQALAETAGELLFNRDQPVSLAYSQSRFLMGEEAGEWEILQTSIGQGATQMTPLHCLMITAAIANEGVLMQPYLIDRVENAAGETVKSFAPAAWGNMTSREDAKILTEMMEGVVAEGTGSAVRGAAYRAAAKTGSAQFETGKESHAWFTGFAPADDPKIAVTVIVEEGGSGGQAAGPVARAVFDAYLN